jgi:small multidrug resistance family-3 protein
MLSSMPPAVILVAAAVFEVAGDAVVRRGIRGGGVIVVLLGALMLGLYGVIVNSLGWDFSRLLGVYVALFAAVAVLAGRFVFHDAVPASTWLGLAFVVVGGLVIQYGPALGR